MIVESTTQVEGLWNSGLLKLLIATPELAWATDAGQAVALHLIAACHSAHVPVVSVVPESCDFHCEMQSRW